MFGRITLFLYGLACYLAFLEASYTRSVFWEISRFPRPSILDRRHPWCRRWRLTLLCWVYSLFNTA